MATRKVRRGRKTRGRKRGGNGEGNGANVEPVAAPVEEKEEVVEPVAAPAAAAAPATANSGNGNGNAAGVGGKRKTRKGGRISRGASKWNQFVMRTFKEMRKKNKDVKLMDAMKECSKQKKKGVKY